MLVADSNHAGFSLHAGVMAETELRDKLAALVPKPRIKLTRFHGVFAPNSKPRMQVTPNDLKVYTSSFHCWTAVPLLGVDSIA